MGTWLKETDSAIYLMEGGYYIDKIAKSPSKSGNGEMVLSLVAMKKWFSRPDAPGAMTVAWGGTEPVPKPKPTPTTSPTGGATSPAGGATKAATGGAARSAKGMKINDIGLRLIKMFEGLELTAYIDAVGIWTIGYGTTSGVKPGMRITAAKAEEFLRRDLQIFEQAVGEEVEVPVTSDQFSALVCFTYNVGAGALAESTLLRLLNKKDYKGAAEQFLRWDKGDDGPLPGLTRRRKAERALFLGEDYTVFL